MAGKTVGEMDTVAREGKIAGPWGDDGGGVGFSVERVWWSYCIVILRWR